ncbi:hypothetical protein Pla175_45020 [Pirellulimonas nuda]|uniref:Uncharacterized protein n=1 Tax=Pirellulimonas nuda TaxID=2528009 RepID=A0A518DHY8_9BACT|nr:hypothetical protein [Pirellulimonas nuda]QDU91084.1 hypothetical protein Pla175_45020 [Pirellulimonas nuda]
MEFNRNQYFFTGLVILLLGIQFRMVESYSLTPEAAKIVQKVGQDSASVAASAPPALAGSKSLSPPDWLGWCLMSVGSVLILHSLAMKKPGG